MSLCVDQHVANKSTEFDLTLLPTIQARNRNALSKYIGQWKTLCHKYETNTFSQQSQANCIRQQTDMRHCPSSQRILIIFKYCQSAQKGTNEIYTDTFTIFPSYNLTHFQNDMDHIIRNHSNQVNDGTFIAHQIGKCDIKDCRVPARESRNGVKSPRLLLFKGSTNYELQQIIRQLFIEEYHSYLFHPIRTERNDIYPDRNDRFVSLATNNTRKKGKKQKNISKIPKSILGPVKEDNASEMEQKYANVLSEGKINDENDNPQFFRFGHKFSYHRFKGVRGKSEGNVSAEKNYVGCKYENLKSELIDDPTKNFKIQKWNIVIAQSNGLSQKNESRNLKAKATRYGWTTQVGKTISIARIVALKLYTDYDDLTFKLCQTYRIDVGDKKRQKQEHSRFAHWAKLLTSTVDIFGEAMQRGHSFFRGLSGNTYVFSLFSTDFNAPCSTTRARGIAWSFAAPSGIVVQIQKPEWRDGARFMDVVTFTAYKHEDEHLFVGPDNFLKIASIHQNVSTKITSTEPLLLLQILTHKMSHSSNKNHKINMCKFVQFEGNRNIICDLVNNLQNRRDSSEYKYELTNYFVTKKTKLYIGVKLIEDLVYCALKKISQKMECQSLLALMGLIDRGCDIEAEIHKKKAFQINFMAINQLFPNINQIVFDFKFSNLSIAAESNNPTWDNLIKYMFAFWNDSNKNNQKLFKSKVCKIVIQRLEKLPNTQFMNEITEKLSHSRWNVSCTENTITFFRGSLYIASPKHNKHNSKSKHTLKRAKSENGVINGQMKRTARKSLSQRFAHLKSKLAPK